LASEVVVTWGSGWFVAEVAVAVAFMATGVRAVGPW
jgi:hypothetical protein